MELSTITEYYGFDWLGMATTFFMLWLLGDKKWYGFVLGMIGAVLWFVFGYLTGSVPAMVLNLTIFFLSVRGLYLWTRTVK